MDTHVANRRWPGRITNHHHHIRPRHAMRTRLGSAGILALVVLAVTAATSTAAGPYEPNEQPSAAFGPLLADTDYAGAVETTNDEDWFRLFTAGPTALDIAVSNTSASSSGCTDVRAELGGAELGSPADPDGLGSVNPPMGTTGHITYSAAGANRFFIRIRNFRPAGQPCDPGGKTPASYTLRVSGALAQSLPLRPPPPPPVPVDNDGDGVPQPQDCNDASTSIRPGLPEIVDSEVDENCDAVVAKRVRATTSVSLSRRGHRYRGRVTSTSPGCVGRRRVVLRRSGSGKRSFGSTRTRANGTWSISRKRLRGRVYAVVADRSSVLTICRVGSSRLIRG